MSWRWISIAAMLAALVIAYGALMRGDSLTTTLTEPPQQPGYYLKDAIINEGYDPQYGARPMKREVQRLISDPLALKLINADFIEGDTVFVDYTGGEFTFMPGPAKTSPIWGPGYAWMDAAGAIYFTDIVAGAYRIHR